MESLDNDRWARDVRSHRDRAYLYTLQAWGSIASNPGAKAWRKAASRQDVAIDLLIGAGLVEETANRATADG